MATESTEVHAPTWTPQVAPTSVGGGDGHSPSIAMGGAGNHISTVDFSSWWTVAETGPGCQDSLTDALVISFSWGTSAYLTLTPSPSPSSAAGRYVSSIFRRHARAVRQCALTTPDLLSHEKEEAVKRLEPQYAGCVLPAASCFSPSCSSAVSFASQDLGGGGTRTEQSY